MEGIGAFAGWQTAALKAHRKSLLWPWPWGACWGSCLRVKVWRVWKRTTSNLRWSGDGVWRVWRVLEGLERLESFGGFAGWQTAALKAHRKPLLWPGPGVPVGEVALALALGPGPGVPVGEVALALGCMLGKVFGILEVWILCRLANCSFEAHRKSLLWPWPPFKEGVWNFRGVAAFAGWQTAALKASRKSLLWI